MKTLVTTEMTDTQYALYNRAQDTNDAEIMAGVEENVSLRESLEEAEDEKAQAIEEARDKLNEVLEELDIIGDKLEELSESKEALERMAKEILDTLDVE